MMAVDAVCEESQADYFEKEIADREVNEAEEEEHTATEVEGEQRIPGHKES